MDRTYPIGLDIWDFGKLYLPGFILAELVLFVLLAVPMAVIGIIAGGILMGMLMSAFTIALLVLSSVFTIPIMAITTFLKASLIRNRLKNHTIVTGKEIHAYKQDNLFGPVIKNTIDKSFVWRIERADDEYFEQRMRMTPWWMNLKVLQSIHKYPQGGLYYPFTDRKNLLVLYLDEPIMFTNREVSFFMQRGPGFLKTLPVKEVILDIRASDQRDFVAEVFGKDPSGRSDGNH